MARRKQRVIRRQKRSPYERSLEYATHRLEKALVEREDYAARLADLDKEIPYLQTVIRALTPPEEKLRPSLIDAKTWGRTHFGGSVLDSVPPPPTEPAQPMSAGQQEAFLQRFVKPVEIPAVGGMAVNPGTSLEDGMFAGDEVVEEIR